MPRIKIIAAVVHLYFGEGPRRPELACVSLAPPGGRLQAETEFQSLFDDYEREISSVQVPARLARRPPAGRRGGGGLLLMCAPSPLPP